MKVRLSDIKPDGLVLDSHLAAEYIGLTKEDHLHFITPLEVHARILKFDNTVISNIQIRGRFESFCYRTLKKVEQDWEDEFDIDMEVTPLMEEVDLGEEIRQEVILRVPDRILSKDGEKEGPYQDEGGAGRSKKKQETHRPFEGLKDIE